MSESENARFTSITEAGQAYEALVKPGETIISMGPFSLAYDPSLFIASYLLKGKGATYIVDPFEYNTVSPPNPTIANKIGPIEPAGGAMEYISEIKTLNRALNIHMPIPTWLGPEQGIFFTELPDKKRAGLIIDRGTSAYVLRNEPFIRKMTGFEKTFQNYYRNLKPGGTVIFQTHFSGIHFRNFSPSFWRSSIELALKVAGFKSVIYHHVQNRIAVPIDEYHYGSLIQSLEAPHDLDPSIISHIAQRVITNGDTREIEFYPPANKDMYSKSYEDLIIATV